MRGKLTGGQKWEAVRQRNKQNKNHLEQAVFRPVHFLAVFIEVQTCHKIEILTGFKK